MTIKADLQLLAASLPHCATTQCSLTHGFVPSCGYMYNERFQVQQSKFYPLAVQFNTRNTARHVASYESGKSKDSNLAVNVRCATTQHSFYHHLCQISDFIFTQSTLCCCSLYLFHVDMNFRCQIRQSMYKSLVLHKSSTLVYEL